MTISLNRPDDNEHLVSSAFQEILAVFNETIAEMLKVEAGGKSEFPAPQVE